MKIVVYQAVFGGRDKLRPHSFLSKGVDYFSIIGEGTLLDAKKFKILPHRYFQEHDVSVWLDGSFKITGDIREVVDRFMDKNDFAVLSHPAETLGVKPTVYCEAEVVVQRGIEPRDKIVGQMRYYHDAGLPFDSEVTMNGILIRRHNDKKIKAFDEEWWKHILRFSSRDQLSFPYLAWKYKLRYVKMDNIGFESDWFMYYPHKKKAGG